MLVSRERAVELEELLILAIGFGKDLVAFRICLTLDDARIAACLGQDFLVGPVGQGRHPLRGLAATCAFIRRLAVAFGDHPLQRRVEVLLRQVGLAQAHVHHGKTKCLGPLIGAFADLVHQGRAFGRQDGVGGDTLRAQHRADLTVENTVQLDLGLPLAIGAKGLTELADVGDAVEHEGVHLEAAVIGGRHLDHRGFQRQDAILETHDLVQQGQLEADARLLADLLDLAEAQHQCLFPFVDDKDRRQRDDDQHHDHGNNDIELLHQFDPLLEEGPLLRPSSFSGR